jgi:Asp-tRNA(Asn)/Glu-tRNA(Gln) amidotransferase A subunit family amidase
MKKRGKKVASMMKTRHTGFQIEEATIDQLHDAMKNRHITCRQLVQAYLKRIEAYDIKGPSINAIITINPNALDIADKLDHSLARQGMTGPLHGIPVLLKDNIDTKDMPTTGGSTSLAGSIPSTDAFITKKLKAAGAILFAKVNLHEFAIWGETASSIAGQTLNPYDLSRTPGGSSGGTGAGIAANFGSVGIGTDTVNSVRSPASANCLVGFRPTLGLVSRSGIIPYSLTQDTAGPITRTVKDAAVLLDVIAGYDAADKKTAWSKGAVPESYTAFLHPNGLIGKKIGILHNFFGTEPVHGEVNSVMENSLRILRDRGALLFDLEFPIDVNEIINDISVHLYDLENDLNQYLSSLGENAPVHSLGEIIASASYHPGIEANIKKAVTLSTLDAAYKDRLLKQVRLRDELVAIMAELDLDAIVYPHQKRPVVKVGETQIERNGALAAVTGFPAITLPAGFSAPTAEAPLGIPIGIEFLGRPWSEGTLFSIAFSFECAVKVRRPPLSTPPLLTK